MTAYNAAVDDLLRRYRSAHNALHRCWTKAVGTIDYVKSDWKIIEAELSAAFADAARALGYQGALLP